MNNAENGLKNSRKFTQELPKKYFFNITPQTNIRATQNDRIFFRIPKDKLYPAGLRRRNQLERYNEYKADLREIAYKKNFIFPEQGLEIHFYIPTPKSWTNYKKKEMNGQLHQQRPDLSNLLKAVEDALLVEDKKIAHYHSISKRWVNSSAGYIEFIVHSPTLSSKDNMM